MSRHALQQRRLNYRGREFHFVAYDAQPANAFRRVAAIPASWFFMNEGKRYLVMEEVPGQPAQALEAELIAWLDANVFAPETTPAAAARVS